MKGRSSFFASVATVAAIMSMAAVPSNAAPKAGITIAEARRAEQRRNTFKAVIAVVRVQRHGWSVAHDRRMAKKRRNVIRNRRAHRG